MRATLVIPGPPTAAALTGALEGLTAQNVAWLERHPSAPPLYSGGVRYRREPRGSEEWRTLPELLASGFGDCEDLAAARAAELNVSGEDPGAFALARPTRKRGLWHIVVQRSDGTIEDPSRVLGMGRKAPEMAGDTDEFKGGWRLFKSGGRWRFEFDLPFGMVAAAKGPTQQDAMRSASAAATQLLQNPAMQAVLPPQATAAIRAASIIAKSPEAAAALKLAKRTGSLVKAAKKLKFW